MRLGVFILLGIVLLGGLFYFLRPKPEATVAPNAVVAPSTTAVPSQAGNSDKVASLVVENNVLVSGNETITLNEGDTIVITITSDAEDELHIHGYEKVVPLQKETPIQVSLTADMTGRYPIELHETETEIAVLEVLPK